MLIFLAAILPVLTAPKLNDENRVIHEKQQEENLSVEENLYGGKILVLSDGSSWEVAPQDRYLSQNWLTPVFLEIEKSAHPYYPYRIINTESKSTVLAKPIPLNTTDTNQLSES